MNLDLQWKEMVARSALVWEKIVHCPSVQAEPLDDLEHIEQGMMQGELDMRVDDVDQVEAVDDVVIDDMDLAQGNHMEWVHL